MIIDGFQKLTLLDYPGFVACIIFTKGCNFRCAYCHNSLLIPYEKDSVISEEEVLAYLKKRKGVLDGIVISGGEPLLQSNITHFIQRVKELGMLVKLDTNGSNPDLLNKLINDKLVDYVAMDVKNCFNKYALTIGKKTNIDNIMKSIEILKEARVDYEFRTTIVKELHTKKDILEIAKIVGSKSKFYLQNFILSDHVLNKELHGFSEDELNDIKNELVKKYPMVEVRNGEMKNV